MNSLSLAKANLRNIMLSKLRSLSSTQFFEAGKQIANKHITPWLELYPTAASKVALFANLDNEISTLPLDNILQKIASERYLPYFENNEHLEFYRLADNQAINSLAKGAYGIRMPEITGKYPLPAANFTTIFIPGISFDKKGNRLGRGKGHYDRLLAPLRNIKAKPLFIGLAMDQQIENKVPVDEYDVPMDFICTPSLGMLDVRRT